MIAPSLIVPQLDEVRFFEAASMTAQCRKVVGVLVAVTQEDLPHSWGILTPSAGDLSTGT
jgi:hypothetical protein